MMEFYSTGRIAPNLHFGEAVIRGLAPDNGLYFPEEIPPLPPAFFDRLPGLSLAEIGFETMRPFAGSALGEDALRGLVAEVLSFPIPLVEVEPGIFSLELYHGPTLAFKDVGARFMARCLAAVSNDPVTVLVATSGDTGSAVAHGFLGVPGVDVVLLYPSGKISHIQEMQLTTLGRNITALEVDGVFDDCQHMVKQAFLDESLRAHVNLTSANSINIARWLPQMIYYFAAVSQAPTGPKTVAVPSGNFGNLTAGMMGQQMGLPIDHFIAATNRNRVIPDFLAGERYQPRPSVPTISNAMDVGAPSNFVRMQEVYGDDEARMRDAASGFWLDDPSTEEVMRSCYLNTGYVLDPHGAIGYAALKARGRQPGEVGIFLETAHPSKFGDVVESAIGQKPNMPERLAVVMDKEKRSVPIGNRPEDLKAFLLNRN